MAPAWSRSIGPGHSAGLAASLAGRAHIGSICIGRGRSLGRAGPLVADCPGSAGRGAATIPDGARPQSRTTAKTSGRIPRDTSVWGMNLCLVVANRLVVAGPVLIGRPTPRSSHATAYMRQPTRGNLHAAACTHQLGQSGTALLPGMSGLQRHRDVNPGSEVEQVRRLPAQRRAEREARPHPPEPGLHGRVEEVD